MGVSLYCKKTKKSIDMPCSGFNRLRDRISYLYGEPWASHHHELMKPEHIFFFDKNEEKAFFERFDKKTAEMIAKKKVPVKLVDFCLQSDGEGRIHYGACKLLLKIIGDYDGENEVYGYGGWNDAPRMQHFKELLQECVENKCDLVWW